MIHSNPPLEKVEPKLHWKWSKKHLFTFRQYHFQLSFDSTYTFRKSITKFLALTSL